MPMNRVLPLFILFFAMILNASTVDAQEILLLDRYNGNKVINDSIVTVYGTDPETIELTMYFVMKNNTDKPLSLFLSKEINMINDSTIDYFCFGIKCWPDTYLTDYPDTIQPGEVDYTFASHVVHYRRFENPPLPPGKSSITYTVFDTTTFDETVKATVTVIYHLSGVGLEESKTTASNIYPNPASDKLIVVSDSFTEPVYTLYLFNTMGTLVRAHNLRAHANKAELGLEDLPSGYYYGKMVSEKNIIDFRFIKE
jgi:hypothetical protein